MTFAIKRRGASFVRLVALSALAVAALCLSPAQGRAGDWPGWRGPTGLGYTDEKDLPLTWARVVSYGLAARPRSL